MLLTHPIPPIPAAHQQVDLALVLGLDLGRQRPDAVRAAGLQLEDHHPGTRSRGLGQSLGGSGA
jgi:hypothetical protein